MKVLIVHNRYQIAGGEDKVVDQEISLLRKHGHEVQLYEVDNHEIGDSFLKKASVAWNVPYSRASRDTLSKKLGIYRPEIAHIHNWFPLLTPSIYDACREFRVPVVQTLHNYRPICANALLRRAGKICEDCVTGSPYQGVLHGCYRDSRFATLPVARMIDLHRHEGTWNKRVDRFIALTEFSKSRFIRAGFDPAKISVKSNFVEDPVRIRREKLETIPQALFVGRLSTEKGLRTLLAAWVGIELPLKIVGEGPLMAELKRSAPGNVEFLGLQPEKIISDLMANSSFMVLPSEWYEGFPMVLVEAFAHGLPVLGSKIGSLEELIENEKTGLHFNPGEPEGVRRAVRTVLAQPNLLSAMSSAAREEYVSKYNPDRNYRNLMAIYSETIR